MICYSCNIDKQLTDFVRRGTGYRGICKKCKYERDRPLIKKAKAKKYRKYRDLQNKWERQQTELVHYIYAKKRFLTTDEFLFEALHRLLILKRTIKTKENENIQQCNPATH